MVDEKTENAQPGRSPTTRIVLARKIETQLHTIQRVVSGPRAGIQNLVRYSVFKDRDYVPPLPMEKADGESSL